ncbi:MAG: hypothetical protein GYB65_05370, partial [Chloroflexi bacterium]|nr:hypothetical protein [Chloroflexota bacterium]
MIDATLDNTTATTAHDEYNYPDDTPSPGEGAVPVPDVRLSLEAVLYLALAVLALALRLANLGTAPINDAEAHDALAALRA